MKSKKVAKPLFNSCEIANALAGHLDTDLSNLPLEYARWSPSLAMFVETQKSKLLKKYVNPRQPLDLETETYIKFLDVCDRIKHVNENFVYPDTLKSGSPSRRDRVLLRAKSLCSVILGDITEEELFLHCRVSSGANRGVPYKDTSPERKLLGNLSYAEGVDKWFKYYLSWDHSLNEALTLSGRRKYVFERFVGSKAAVVPKDASTLRMICVEPTLNMFFQQGVMHVMSERLKDFGLSFDVLQDVHRQLAQISSITQKNATIDWSSASDCVSMSLVRFLLPRTWLHYVEAFRCKNIEIGGSIFEIPMVSTMGNATTFPLETLVFYCLAVANLTDDSQPRSVMVNPELWERVSVFGDDCIVPDSSAESYIEIMRDLGFIPNIEKSFFGPGGFRESCGGDFLHGIDVRPYNLRAPINENLSSLEPWLYIILNRVLNRYIHIWGPLVYMYDKELVRFVFSLFRLYKLKLKLVPTHFPDDSGFKFGSDWCRISKHYEVPELSPITRDMHGSYNFLFCSVRYPTKRRTDDILRYALCLKEQLKTVDHAYFSLIRKDGGYTVAKSKTCFFSLNL